MMELRSVYNVDERREEEERSIGKEDMERMCSLKSVPFLS